MPDSYEHEQQQQQDENFGRGYLQQFDKYFTNPFYDFDEIKNRYPAFSNQIQSMYDRGYSKEQVSKFFSEQVEPRLNFVGNGERVERFLGRTEQTKQLDDAFQTWQLFNGYKKAFPDKSNDDIFNAIEISRQSGISAGNLLRYPDAYKKFIGDRKERESYWESIKRGAGNYFTQNDKGHIGVLGITGHLSREEVIKQAAEYDKQMIQEPAITTFGNRFLAGTAGVIAQGQKNILKGGLTGAGLAGVGAAIGAPLGVAGPMAEAFGKAGFVIANAWELFEDQAGNDYIDLIQMKDENGKYLDENVARVTAIITGAITVGTELAGLKYALNITPGGSAIKHFLGMDKQHIINAVATNPVIRDALSRIVIDTSKGIGISTLNNVVEAINTDLKVPLAKAISSQPFPNTDWREWFRNTGSHVADTTITSLRDFSGSALVTGATNLITGRSPLINVYKVNQALDKTAQEIGVPRQQLEQQLASEIQKQQIAANEKLNDTQAPPVQDTQQVVPAENAQTETITPPAEAVTEQAAENNEAQIQTVKNPDYVFIPSKSFAQFVEQHPELAETQTFFAGEETGLTFEQYSQMRQLDPNFFMGISNSIRYDADGVTADEAMQKINAVDPAQARAFHSAEIQQGIKQAEKNYIHAGVGSEEAQSLGQVYGAVASSILAQTGVQIKPMEIITPEDMQAQQQRDNDMSRVTDENYDINNPQTWTDQTRAQQFMNAAVSSNLSNIELYIKKLLETVSTKFAPNGEAESSMSSLLREEFKDFARTLRIANQDAIDALSKRTDLDSEHYEINPKFPRGKSNNPDFRYEAPEYGGKMTIDIAQNNDNLYVKVKRQGIRNPFTLAIKNFKQADLLQVVNDLANDFTAKGVELSRTPVMKNIAKALWDVWSSLGLKKSSVDTHDIEHSDVSVINGLEGIERTSSPAVLGEVSQIQRPDVLSVNTELQRPETIQAPEEFISPPEVDNQANVIDDAVNATILKIKEIHESTPTGKPHDISKLWNFHKELGLSDEQVNEVFKRLQDKGFFRTTAGHGNAPSFVIPDIQGLHTEAERLENQSPQTNSQQTQTENTNLVNEALRRAAQEIKNIYDEHPEYQDNPANGRYDLMRMWEIMRNIRDELGLSDEQYIDLAQRLEDSGIMHGVTEQRVESSFEDMSYTEIVPSHFVIPNIEAVYSALKESAPEIIKEGMPQPAREHLTRDQAAWNDTARDLVNNPKITTRSQTPVKMMETPLVLTLVGAEHLPLYINDGKLKKIMHDHPSITPENILNLPNAIAEPVAVFESKSEGQHPAKVILTEMKDSDGASVLAAFHLDYSDKTRGTFNKLASSYSKESGGRVNNKWFETQAKEGRLRYIDTDKAAKWAQDTGITLIQEGEPLPEGVKTQKDLQALWNEHEQEGYYKTNSYGERVARVHVNAFGELGRSMVELIAGTKRGADYATHVHELGHALFGVIDGLAEQGVTQMQTDRDYVIQRAGVTVEQWLADTDGVREKVHEWFADAFEVYLSEGKAPNKKLEGIFERARKFLLQCYDDIQNQLGITLTDEDRELFDRLLGMPGNDKTTIGDFVIQDRRLNQQIIDNDARMRAIEQEHQQAVQAENEHMQMIQDMNAIQQNANSSQKIALQYLDDVAHADTEGLNPEAAQQVANYLMDNDDAFNDAQALAVEQENFKEIYAAIKEAGGINGADVEEWFGAAHVNDFAKRHRQIYTKAPRTETYIDQKTGKRARRRAGIGYDTVVEQLANMGYFIDKNAGESSVIGGGDAEAFWSWLEAYDPSILNTKPREVLPYVAINADTLNVFLAADGTEGTIDYLKARKKHLQSMREDDYDYEVDRKKYGITTPEAAQAELKEIDEWLKILDPAFDEDIETVRPKKKKITVRDLKQAARSGYEVAERKASVKQALSEASIRQEYKHILSELEEQYRQEKLQAEQEIIETKQQAAERRKAEAQKARERRELALSKLKEQQKERREKDKTKQKERLEKITQRMQEKQQKKIDRLTARYQKQLGKVKARRDNLLAVREQLHKKNGIRRMIKRMIGMKKSKAISWEALQEIKGLVDSFSYDKDETNTARRDLLRTYLEGFEDNESEGATAIAEEFAEEYNITPEELDDFSSHTYINDMTLGEVKKLFKSAQAIYRQGRAEYETWKAERQARRDSIADSLAEAVRTKWPDPEPGKGKTIKDREDITHQYKLGKVGEILNSYNISSMTPGRFLEKLGEPFRRVLGDGFNERIGDIDRHVQDRINFVMTEFQKLGVQPYDMGEVAINVNGENFTWQQVIEIYAGWQNEFSQNAILYGNFLSNLAERHVKYLTEQDARTAIGKILMFINEPENAKYKQAAEVLMQDFENNVDRIQEAQIRDFNRGFDKQPNYSPMFRLRHQTSGGFQINAETEEIARNSPGELFQKLADGFTRPRVEINPLKQQPIDLNFFNNWYKAMIQEEYNAGLGGYAADVFSALTTTTVEHESIQQMIKERVGENEWMLIKDIYNNSINDSATLEAEAADKFTGWLTQARSFAYVAYSPISILSQSTSYFLALPYTNRAHLFRSLANFVEMGAQGRGEEFLENVYQKYPELRYSAGDPMLRTISNMKKYGGKSGRARSKYSEWAYLGTAVLDRWTKAIVFDAVYNSRKADGMSENDAVRMAIRAVQDTQPASHAREMTAYNRSRGAMKLIFFQFMNALAPIYNVGVVDVARNLASRKWNKIKAAAWSALGAGLAIGFAGLIKDGLSGRLPTGEEREDGATDNWSRYFIDTIVENMLNTFPIINSALVEWYRRARGNKTYRSQNRVTEPFEALGKAYSSLVNEDKDFDWDNAFKAAALFGVKIPYSGAKQLLRFLGLTEDKE